MKLILLRNDYFNVCTIGDLIIDHKIFCHTLEDMVRHKGAVKVPGATAIPAGRYELIVNMSNRFKREMPLLMNVPQFSGIRMHGGNTEADTEGCIILAFKIAGKKIYQTAEKDLTALLKSIAEPHTIEIIDSFPYVA